MTNCWKFVKFVNISPRQNFVPYGIMFLHIVLFFYLELDSNSLSSGAVVAIITFAVTFIIAMAIITFIITYICVKKNCKGVYNLNNQPPQEKVLYEEVGSPNQTIVNSDVKLQLNPAYGTSTSYNVNMNHTNPVYEICNNRSMRNH